MSIYPVEEVTALGLRVGDLVLGSTTDLSPVLGLPVRYYGVTGVGSRRRKLHVCFGSHGTFKMARDEPVLRRVEQVWVLQRGQRHVMSRRDAEARLVTHGDIEILGAVT